MNFALLWPFVLPVDLFRYIRIHQPSRIRIWVICNMRFLPIFALHPDLLNRHFFALKLKADKVFPSFFLFDYGIKPSLIG